MIVNDKGKIGISVLVCRLASIVLWRFRYCDSASILLERTHISGAGGDTNFFATLDSSYAYIYI